MKIRMAASALALFMLSEIAFSLSTVPERPITRSTLNGVWVCYGGQRSARLEVNPDDSGFLIFESTPPSRAQSFKLVLDDVHDGRFNFKAEEIRASYPVKVSVLVGVHEIQLDVENDNWAVESFWLESESDATAQMQRFKASADAMRSGK
jgi:hypothetical protein